MVECVMYHFAASHPGEGGVRSQMLLIVTLRMPKESSTLTVAAKFQINIMIVDFTNKCYL